MYLNKAYYTIKFLIPRSLQLSIRRYLVRRKLVANKDIWPIDPSATEPIGVRENSGYLRKSGDRFQESKTSLGPDGNKFALRRMKLEVTAHGFRSSFNFVAGDYPVPASLRQYLTEQGFEIGIHGLHHKHNPFRSQSVFRKQSIEINRILKEWGSVGFRCPSMYHNLDLLHYLDIEYDSSTFDTDPFEPQPDGMGTIFPFWVPNQKNQKGYVELPYTLPQDFLLFILMQAKNIGIWKKKLGWIAGHGGMVLINVHPDYMYFDNGPHKGKYPVKYYEEFLEYIKLKYEGQYWQALPRDVARFWAGKNVPASSTFSHPASVTSVTPIHTCMLVYSFYETDNRVMRYAEALAKRGDSVDVIALATDRTPRYEEIGGVKVYRIQKRTINEKGRISYLLKLMMFFFQSFAFVTLRQMKTPYNLIHVHSVPDFEVFATVFSKLKGAKIILDIHDIVPEFYASKFHKSENTLLFKALILAEKLSCKYADHVIISNHLWEKKLLSRSVDKNKCTTIINYPDESTFYRRPRERNNDKFIMIYPGTLGWHQGLDIAIRAFALIQDQAPESEFHIYGQGSEAENLKRLIADFGLENRVVINELMPIKQIAAVMANADLGIVPKRNDPFGGEAFSTKILEFMSLGIPVIVSETKIDKFYYTDSVVKFFKPGDVDDLAQCMVTLIKDKEVRDRLCENAQKFVTDYSWEKRCREYYDIVDKLVKNTAPGKL
jgi:glycosyltransferase involved in cell wall biosynthesis/peptidoglycan/xylan/chitin deacetylase (PgdA/CDA1 family)